MMNIGQKCSQTILDLSKKIAVNLRLSQNLHHLQSNHVNKVPLAIDLSKVSSPPYHPGRHEDNSIGAFKSLDLMKNVELELTAKFWCSQASQPNPKTIEEPMLKIPLGQIPPPVVGQVPTRNFSIIEEPINKVIIEKKAHRRLIIRKRKMKIHRRKRRWKRNWVMYRKGYLDREKKRETAFRQRMIAKVNEANTFDAKKYVEDYLEDAKYELVPKTYEGKRLPQWLIKQLLEEDELKALRVKKNSTNLLTGQPLIKPNETVQDFENRSNK